MSGEILLEETNHCGAWENLTRYLERGREHKGKELEKQELYQNS